MVWEEVILWVGQALDFSLYYIFLYFWINKRTIVSFLGVLFLYLLSFCIFFQLFVQHLFSLYMNTRCYCLLFTKSLYRGIFGVW